MSIHDKIDIGNDALSFIISLTTIVTIAWKGRWIIQKLKEMWLTVTGARSLAKQMEEHLRVANAAFIASQEMTKKVLEELQKIRSEVTPNSGHSMHDQVTNIYAILKAKDDREQVPIFSTNDKGDVVHVNRAYKQLVGKDLEEIMGRGWNNIVFPEDRPSVHKSWQRAQDENRDLDETFRIIDSNGLTRRVRATAKRLVSAKGKYMGYYGEWEVLD